MAIALSWPSHHSTAYLPAHGHLSARHSPIRACAVIAPDEQLQLRQLFDAQVADAADRKVKASTSQSRLSALGSARDLWPLPPRLKPHDIPVMVLEDGILTEDALRKLLSHECCAVHIKGFVDAEACAEIASRLAESAAFSNWNIHQAKDEGTYTPTDVDKFGVTSNDALESWERFQEYLEPSSDNNLDSLLPGKLNPFTNLRNALEKAHPDGCRLRTFSGGRWALPPGTFRRMRSSKGLIHADTATLLARDGGEFSANIYIRTPRNKRGSLSIYPAMQYASPNGGVTSPALLADLQSLAMRQSEGFDTKAQEALRAALPLRRTIDLSDGDCVLISTGRFHGVEPYEAEDGSSSSSSGVPYRLSGQCWLSYRQGKPLRMWV